MKYAFGCALLLASIVSLSAQGAGFSTELTRFYSTPPAFLQDVAAGHVEVNTKSKWISAEFTSQPCAEYGQPGAVCIAMVKYIDRSRARLRKIQTNRCGDIVYTARSKSRSGNITEIMVKDNRKFHCPSFAPVPTVEVYINKDTRHGRIEINASGSEPIREN